MAERIFNAYKRLFEIRLLHHYWLDEGTAFFDMNADQAEKEARLLKYDVRSFLALAPTPEAAKALSGLGGIYKNTALGCVAAVPGGAMLPADATFDFVVTVQNPDFFNYTALTLRPQTIHEFYYQPEKKTYRYKGNVPVLSNLTGAARGAGAAKTLFLSREYQPLAADDPIESLVLSRGALVQLTSDQPDARTQELALAANVPVFVNQGDAPAINPPAGLAGAPKRGIELSADISDAVFAFIRLAANGTGGSGDSDFSFVDAGGHAKTPNPVYHIRFKSRSTIWQYRNKITGALIAAEAEPLPLTYFGNAGTKQKPTPGLVKATFDPNVPSKVTGLVSEIFI